MSKSSARGNVPFGLVPPHLNYGAVAPFIYETMFALELLSDENPVRQYTRAEPDAHRAILALSRAVALTGIRVRDTNKKGDAFDEHLGLFTADEIWMFDLAIDVVAMFATGGGLSSDTGGMAQDRLRSIDKHVHSHHWKAQVRKAGEGPAEFRALRNSIPHHRPA
jgi:hypothetical protein